MNKLSPGKVHLAWLALAAVAFFAGTSFRQVKPASDEPARSASPVVDAPAGSAVVVSAKMKLDRKSAAAGGPVGTTRLAVAPEMVVEKLGRVIDGREKTVAAQRARKVAYREELLALVKSLTVENARDIAAAFDENYRGPMKTDEIEPAFQEFFRAWGALAGADAMAFEEQSKSGAAEEIMSGWAKSDPVSAKAYALKLDAGSNRGADLHTAFVVSLADTNLDDAIAHSLNYEKMRPGGSGSASELAKKIRKERGVEGIESWFVRMEETLGLGEAVDFRSSILQSGIANIVREDPTRARKWLLDFASRGVVSVETLKDAADRVSADTRADDELSLIAMARPPTVEEQGRYSELLTDRFANYLRLDIIGAGTWLAKQPRDPRYDGAIQKFALAAVGADREAGLEWAQQISDERLREATLARPEFNGDSSVVRPRKQ